MPESNPSLPNSNINMETSDNAYLAYTLDQLLGVLHQIVTILPPDRICEILPAPPAVPDTATSEAVSNGMQGKISEMNADQFSQFMASTTALPGQTQALKFTDFKGIIAPLIPQEQKANAKFAPDAVNWLSTR
ncbi:hypothetical protein COEREDRAFT_12542 [Coemansia reversa NRRL 1564]|uniref:Uncharacterized protein n=1 Tax=Coemansia reversa (strain ATCC 12441 / NRRL 1564) TaxID=763665 RepID=A0A2G5B0R3_COERN|nr:hypothetical protein COEREDRAFT_12542 [Coemansia reversa NRRL 1564]|eukprot:PIA12599.1 hypothetical protein COEREDRAFT_12542 [Coemansia reversa NRRL 1564]